MSQFWSTKLASVQPYVPGEQPKVAGLIKLNTNENPYPPSPHVLAAIQSELANSAERLRLYPDPNADLFKDAVIRHIHPIANSQLSRANVFAGNGSDEVLGIAFQALLQHKHPILLPDISYSFYPVYCGLYDIAYQTIPLSADFCIRVADYDVPNGGIILANPNAPTGLALPLTDIERLVTAHPQSVVIIDEAYVDFGAESAVKLIAHYPNLLVVRTLSKSHALAGLRLGYALGHEDLISGLERVKNSFNSYPLDRLAIVGGSAALDDQAYLEKTRRAVIKSRTELSAGLGKLGFHVLPSCANFIFATHPQYDAAILAAALRERKIIVRHLKAPRIKQFLRISIGTEAECQALLDAIAILVHH